MTSRSRRRFLAAAGATLATGAVAGCSDSLDDRAVDDEGSTGVESGPTPGGPSVHPFRGDHQIGVVAPATAAGLVVALDVRAGDRNELATTLADLGGAIEAVMSGEPYERRDGGFPPYDTGILGPAPGPTDTTVVVGYGDSLFDDRFGLADRRPNELQPMPRFANDYLVSEERSHGDLSLAISAASHEAAVHAFRQVMRATRGDLIPRWMKEGFADLAPDPAPGTAPMRNLMGFKDGTANPDTTDAGAMDRIVWVQPDDGQPDWAIGGTYQAIRIIRMMVEFWDRTRLSEQEQIFGRHRDSGAPLGLADESEIPVLDDLESHIARANPRTPDTERNLILRRGLNYSSGFDENDQMDQGLIFVSYQRSLNDGFITVQRRLDGEALEEYIRPLGGGFFFVPPPPAEGEPLGAALLA